MTEARERIALRFGFVPALASPLAFVALTGAVLAA
jgi:hypothetical protein